ncbi:hypothetical protein JKP88DRAFT_227325 [Tribonema minus]|uniref:Phytanoyl-CoA dioxygenase n=1 Tax=Tribonema minus TaxID=303371 RepID=A0A835YKI9_9STRA|nr:hypothetical protein JKP88DRAFT_227325 [Tribonema minus]
MKEACERLLSTLPPIDTSCHPWERIFNPVHTRHQVKLFDVASRSPFVKAKRLVEQELGPLINRTLLGLGDREVTRPALLLSNKTSKELAHAQPPHRDWMLNNLKAALKHNNSFPVGVIISLHDSGELHVWPGSFDATEVNEKDRVTVRLDAGDIILFHGALIHAGAGYEGDDGEYHLRLHFYTQTAHGREAWPVVKLSWWGTSMTQ